MKKQITVFIIVLLTIILLKIFVITPVFVKGNSMEGTLKNGEITLLYKFGKLKRGSLVVVNVNGEKIIKRIVGLPGEKIKSVNGQIYIDDKYYNESYISSKNSDFKEVIIEKNKYFVLGDNREKSKDSREFGTIEKKQILGTIII